MAKSPKTTDSSTTSESSPRDTVTIPRPDPAHAHWTGPVLFTDIDLSVYSVLNTKVFGTCRLSIFARKDRTRAYLLAEGDTRQATEDRLGQILRLSQVALSPDGKERIAQYLEAGGQMDGETCAIVIAEGKAPVDGQDSELEWPCGTPAFYGAGKEAEDGTVDYRERQTFVHVKPGDLILRVTPPTKGTPGADFQGNPVPARNGDWRRPLAGTNVRTNGASQTELYAVVEGVLEVDHERVSVKPMLELVEVNFGTGNIRFTGDVSVAASVAVGFEVEASGMLQIGGDVSQATLSGAHVFVLGRTVGSTITARGRAELHLTEGTTVAADAGITIKGDAVRLTADCGGRLFMPEHKLAGGRLNCLGGLEVGWLGGSTGDATVIEIDPDTCRLPCVAELTGKIMDGTAQLAKLNIALEPVRQGGQAAINKMGTQQRDAVKQLMAKADQLSFELTVNKSQRKKLMDPIVENIKPQVKVNRGVSSGVRVVIGGKSWTADHDLEGAFLITFDAASGMVVARPFK